MSVEIMAGRKRSIWPFAAAAAVLLALAAYYVVWSSGYFATETSLEIFPETEDGGIEIAIQAENKDGRGLQGALVHIYAEDRLVDSLYTDTNGRALTETGILPGWYGSGVSFSAEYRGDENHLPSSAAATAIVMDSPSLSIGIANSTTVGERLSAKVRLEGIEGAEVFFRGMHNNTDENGTAHFALAFNSTGMKQVNAEFRGNRYLHPARATAWLEVLPETCSDQTVVGECSGSCLCTRDQELEFNCAECGCPSGLLCIENECITEEQRVQKLIKRLQESDVFVESDRGSGSGVIIEAGENQSIILTNRHVVDPDFSSQSAPNIQIFNSDREVAKPKSILLAPNGIDLALIYIGKYLGPEAEAGYNQSIERGAGVLAIGSPLGIQDSVTMGIVSNFYDAETEEGFEYQAIQVDAAVNPGNSGGGLFLSSNGKLVAITTFKLVISQVELAEGLGFAIPLSLVDDYPIGEWTVIAP
ncbi:trypsin-like serine protease [Candidatus Micrarchaeota archaeon]|nr:trypsin-like serine protease [Candidatus Micrarchaeota archaeon]